MAYSIRFPRRHDKADRNGRYAVRLCITKNKRRKYIALELYADPAYWDEAGEQFIILRNLKGAEQKAENKQREADNALLVKYKARAREIVERFEIEGIDWTLNQFEDAFLNTSKQGKFNAYFTDRIAELHATGHIGNSQTYKQTQDMLRSYDRKLDQRLFSDIDLRYVRGFDMFLQKRSCCGNTRKFYFKALRAILNRANAEGVGSVATYPFDGADSRSPNSKRRPPNATCLPPSYRNSKAPRPTIRNANTPASCFSSPTIVTAFRSSTWLCSRPPISNRWRTAIISSTSGRRSSGRKESNRFRSRSRPQSGN